MSSSGLENGNIGGSANPLPGAAALQAQEGEDTDTETLLETMWANATQDIRNIVPETENWKIQPLPLARIKKIMKSEEFVMQELEKDRCAREGLDAEEKTLIKFMISAEAPLIMSKACDLLIQELTVRAWQHTSRSRRRTLQRQDVQAAVGESDVYDFLIDVVPRVAAHHRPPPTNAIPMDMGQPGPSFVVQNFGLPPGQINLNMPVSMLQHQGATVGVPGAPDIGSILLDQQHHQLQQEQLMLGFPSQLAVPSSNVEDDNSNGQQQPIHSNAARNV